MYDWLVLSPEGNGIESAIYVLYIIFFLQEWACVWLEMPVENEGMGAVVHVLCIESSCLHIRQSMTKTNQRPCSLAQGRREDSSFSIGPFEHVLF